MSVPPSAPPPPLSALEGALLDNLELRGVTRRLRAAVLAVVLDVIREDGVGATSAGAAGAGGAGASARAAAAAAAAASDPDALLSRALVADFLRATGCDAALEERHDCVERGRPSANRSLPPPEDAPLGAPAAVCAFVPTARACSSSRASVCGSVPKRGSSRLSARTS